MHAPLLLLLLVAVVTSIHFESRCGDDDWPGCRQRLIEKTFGASTLPNRRPDWIVPPPLSAASNNRTGLVWEISDKHGPTLNATVFWTLNSTTHAPRNFLPADFHPTRGGDYRWPHFPKAVPASSTLVLYHNGHEPNDGIDLDQGPSFFNQLGFDVMEFDMPLYGWNKVKDVPCDHEWFEKFEILGCHCLRYFVEPVMLAANYALDVIGYSRLIMVGLSGGGWTTTYCAALNPRIEISFPVAGGVPFDMRTREHSSWDWEQKGDRNVYEVATFLDWMVLGGFEENRAQLQVLHEMDSCCFCGCGREQLLLEYNRIVQSHVQGGFRTALTTGNIHEINPMDRVLAGFLAGLPETKDALPFFKNPSMPLPYDQLYQFSSESCLTHRVCKTQCV